MNQQLLYTPAYAGLFASMLLALACNTFLDIQYGAFGFEMTFWAALLGWTQYVGWSQHGEVSDGGATKQKIVLLIALVLAVLVFIPMWGFPRAGLYILAILQASQNCVTTTRRQLYFGLLVSVVMVMFAASHFRADWTMLFYLIPYIVAVVFTLVSEQISRRAQTLREESLGNPGARGQVFAIGAAVGIILLLGAALYVATPQLSWPSLASSYGQPGGGGASGGTLSREGGSASGEEGGGGAYGNGASVLGQLPNPAQMREAAARPGMPGWQAGTILVMADVTEGVSQALTPLKEAAEAFWERFKEWMAQHKKEVLASLLGILFLMILLGLWFLCREIKVVLWLRTRFDYWCLVRFGRLGFGRDAHISIYRAVERLLLVNGMPRTSAVTAREYCREVTLRHDGLNPLLAELTDLFERFRYGESVAEEAEITYMSRLYRQLFEAMA